MRRSALILALLALPAPGAAQELQSAAGNAQPGFLSRAIAVADSIVSWCIQVQATETAFCRESIQLLQSLRPGLEVARLVAEQRPAAARPQSSAGLPARLPSNGLPTRLPTGLAAPASEPNWGLMLPYRAVSVTTPGTTISHLITFCAGGSGTVYSEDTATGANETASVVWEIASTGGAAALVLTYPDGNRAELPLRALPGGGLELGDEPVELQPAPCQ